MRIRWFSCVRVLGLLWVLLYHFYPKYFPGGFVGVDVFFTFSGFLITALMIDEVDRTGRVDMQAFLRRRLYRIVPPVVLMLLVTLPLTWLVWLEYIADLPTQVAGVLGYVTNLYEMLTGGNYEDQFIPHLFVHNWSLAVEVHFYLLWSFLLYRLAKRSRNTSQFRGSVITLSLPLLVVSYGTMVLGFLLGASPSMLYFASLSHLFPFFFGSLLAAMTGVSSLSLSFEKRLEHSNWPGIILGSLLGVTILIGLLIGLRFDQNVPYLGGLALAALAATALIRSLRLLHNQLPDVAEPAWLTFLADTSYGVYLFHWPLYSIFKDQLVHWQAVFLTVLLSYTFAAFSFYIMEPILAGRQHFNKSARMIMGLVLVGLVTASGVRLYQAPVMTNFARDMAANNMAQSAQGLERLYYQVNPTARLDELEAEPEIESLSVPGGLSLIGDSVALRANTQLNQVFPDGNIDAAGSRNLTQARAIMNAQAQAGILGKTVVLGIGVNIVSNYKEELDGIIKDLPKGHRLVLVTPYDGNSDQYVEATAEETWKYELKLARKHSFITLADWHKVSLNHPEMWEDSDNIHFGGTGEAIQAGAKIYAETVRQAVEAAQDKPTK